jgi:hypothetical protein
MEIVQNLHGVPKIVVSDRDTIFTENSLTELISCLGTELAHKSSYHPQSYGKTKIHGVPNIVVSDRDPIFMGNFSTNFFFF